MDDTDTGPPDADDRPPSPGDADAAPERSVVVQDPERRLDAGRRDWLRSHAESAMAYLEAHGELTIRVIGDEAMAVAHERFIGLPDPTDVLTFDFRDEPRSAGEDRGPLETDVFVCLDEAERNADERGHDAMRELLLYAVHGLLHCLGHDDHDEARAAAMHAKEDEVLAAIGVGAVYARDGDATP